MISVESPSALVWACVYLALVGVCMFLAFNEEVPNWSAFGVLCILTFPWCGLAFLASLWNLFYWGSTGSFVVFFSIFGLINAWIVYRLCRRIE